MDDSLTTQQINCCLSSHFLTSSHYEGCFALDELPLTYLTKRPSLVVVNTAYSGSPGEHWVCFFLTDNDVFFFDSYGIAPSHKTLLDFIAQNGGSSLNYNTRCLQGLLATTCGKFCTTYLLCRALGHSHVQYLALFPPGSCPDHIVRKLYDRYFQRDNLAGGQTRRPRKV